MQDHVLGAAPRKIVGFDRWGFRNREVPESADIVAIGDSHTYGNAARMEDSWPYVLGRLTGRRVYNLAMGGYGPNQYYYLLKNRALSLKPRLVICGLYLGDDFENAFTITYGLDYWAYLRKLPGRKVDYDIWWASMAPGKGWNKGSRVWLSRHSVAYQLLFHVSSLGRLEGEVQIRDAARFDHTATSLNLPGKNILEAFHPAGMLERLDQNSTDVQEGMRITFQLLNGMNEICHQNHAQFLVVVIPTKEMVFADYLEHKPDLPLSDVVDKLLVNERLAMQKTAQFFTDSNIAYVDALPALQRSAEHQLYARTASDMHPNKNGYRVIAEAAFEALKQSEEKK